PRHLQPDADGGAAVSPLRDRHHLGPHLRQALAQGGPPGGGRPAERIGLVSPLEFTSLDLPEPVLAGVRDAGLVTATAIQEPALPLALKGKDVAGQSQTGTGKTAAFLIAAFTRCLRHPAPPRAGVTAPR